MFARKLSQKGNRMRRRILLVDDEVAVLLTLKAVLEISGFDVDTAASAREGISKLHTREYQMLITDMRMEHDVAGIEVIKAARSANYHPAVALLTAFPVAEEDWQEMGADQLLVKPMHTRILLQQIEDLIASHERKLAALGLTLTASNPAAKTTGKKQAVVKKAVVKKAATKKAVAKKVAVRRSPAKKAATAKTSIRKKSVVKKAIVKKAIAKKATKTAAKSARRRTKS